MSMDPNTQPSQPTQEPSSDAMPDAKEPDTGASMPPTSNPVADLTSQTPMLPPAPMTPPVSQPMSTPLPSDANVVTPTTPIATPAVGMSGAPAKKNMRKILIIVLAVVVLAAAGLIFYVTTL